jgi:hypothetical protein
LSAGPARFATRLNFGARRPLPLIHLNAVLRPPYSLKDIPTMQRYTLTEYADASSETRAVFDDFMRTTGATAVPVWLKSLGHSAP